MRYQIEKYPLEILSAGEVGTGDIMHLQFLDSNGYDSGGVTIKFDSEPTYQLDACSSPVKINAASIPSALKMIWTVVLAKPEAGTEGAPRVTLKYNGVEIVDITMSDSVCDYNPGWKDSWETKLAIIKFAYDDNASDNYRPGDFTWRLGDIHKVYNYIRVYQVFTMSASGVYQVFTMSASGVYQVFTMSVSGVYQVFTISASGVYQVFTMSASGVYQVFTMSASGVYQVFTMSASGVYQVFTMSASGVYQVFTTSASGVYQVFTMSASGG